MLVRPSVGFGASEEEGRVGGREEEEDMRTVTACRRRGFLFRRFSEDDYVESGICKMGEGESEGVSEEKEGEQANVAWAHL